MDNYKIDLPEIPSGQTKQIIFSGELSINYIQFIKDEIWDLIEVKNAHEYIVMDAEIIDLSFIQLLISLRNANPKSSINLNINKDLINLISVSGYKEILKKNSK